MRDYFDMNMLTVNINNTSIFSNDSVKKGIDRLMKSPILDFICSMPDDKWEKFQREFFDYYYESFKKYSGEVGFENLNNKLKERKKKIENRQRQLTLNWCFLGKEEYQKEIKEAEKDD